MRTTSLLQHLIGVTPLVIDGFSLEPRGLVLDVRPRHRHPRCGGCGHLRSGYDRSGPRLWRHLGIGDLKIWLRYAPRRVSCRRCGIRTERVSWADPGSRFTHDFEELAAYLARATDKTTVTHLLGVAWRTVGAIVGRVVDRMLDRDRLCGRRRIGVDEFSCRKRHRYLTLVVDHDRGRVVWAGPGKGSEALSGFFRALGPKGCAALDTVTMDMSEGDQKALAEHAPQAEVVFDRFHVQRLASDALDAVRREQLRERRGTPEGRALFRSRFSLWKNPWNLGARERRRLKGIERNDRTLYRAYLLKESLARALDYRQEWRARRALKEWLGWASRSRLPAFAELARTVRKHLEGILAYVGERLTNGIVEGIDTRLRMVARRAFGFHSPQALIAMLYLCCGGVRLEPRLPLPTETSGDPFFKTCFTASISSCWLATIYLSRRFSSSSSFRRRMSLTSMPPYLDRQR